VNSKLNPLFGRRSIRSYGTEPVSDADIESLLQAAMAAPSAAAKDPWRFIVLRELDTLSAVAEGLPNGRMLATAPVGFVVCGVLEEAHGGELSYLIQDCSASIENLLIAAHLLGLGAVWLGVHPREDRVSHLVKVLDLPEGVIPVSAVAVGHPAESPGSRTRYDGSKVFRSRWGRT
jgi:nitroreductase